jgi:hypothetical protein
MSGDLSSFYKNPFRSLNGLVRERIDQGVDANGSGPVYALGNGVVTNLYNSGWPGGSFISYRLTDGPYSGKYVYIAESIHPAVKIGQNVTSNTVVGTMFDGPDGIEMGWAAPGGTGGTMAQVYHQESPVGDPGERSTAFGVLMNDVLTSLGFPGGIHQSGPTAGSVPSGWASAPSGPAAAPSGGGGSTGPTGQLVSEHSSKSGESTSIWGDIWDGLKDVGGLVTAPAAATVGVAEGIGGFAQDFSRLLKMIDWLFEPSSWVRILSGFAGVILLIIAGVMLWKAAGGSSPSGGSSVPNVVPFPV